MKSQLFKRANMVDLDDDRWVLPTLDERQKMENSKFQSLTQQGPEFLGLVCFLQQQSIGYSFFLLAHIFFLGGGLGLAKPTGW